MPTCKDVSRTLASDELAAAGWRRRLSIRLHLAMCRHCRRYASQLRELGNTARSIFSAKSSGGVARDELRDSILNKIPTAQPEDPESKV